MRVVGVLASLALIAAMLLEGFETILQPRRVTHRFRYVRLYYFNAWKLWRAVALRIAPGKRREAFLGTFAPLSLLGLFGNWIIGLILGFALLHWSLGFPLHAANIAPSFGACVYLSGTTFFTLGYGDITPGSRTGHILAVVEAGLGFGFLAIVISYLPVLFQAFSHREVVISLMDARAGSPPSAGQLLLRLGRSGRLSAADAFLAEWEEWAAELLESHLSFPVLSYYRSQHDNQSWLATLTMILDTSALLITKVKRSNPYQAQLTFAMARHAAVDLALILKIRPVTSAQDRLAPEQLHRMGNLLRDAGLELRDDPEADAKLTELRGMYEPFIYALAQRLVFAVPPVLTEPGVADNWQRSAWMQRAPGIGSLPPMTTDKEHFS